MVGLTRITVLHTYNESAELTTDSIIISVNLLRKEGKKEILHI